MRLRTKADVAGFEVVVGDAVIIARPMTASELSRLRARHTTYKRGVETLDSTAMTREMFDRVVTDWRGVDDEAGEPLPCTAENKRAIAEFEPAFVGEVLAAVADEDQARRNAIAGN